MRGLPPSRPVACSIYDVAADLAYCLSTTEIQSTNKQHSNPLATERREIPPDISQCAETCLYILTLQRTDVQQVNMANWSAKIKPSSLLGFKFEETAV